MSESFGSLVSDFCLNSFAFIWPIMAVSNIVFFLLFKWRENICFIDFGWAVNHFIVGLFYFLKRESYEFSDAIFFFILLFLWSFRLAYHLSKRLLKKYNDPRYEMIFAQYTINPNIIYLIQFELQALLTVFSSCSLYFIFKENDVENGAEFFSEWNNVLGGIIIILSIIGEALSDYQLEEFKKNISLNGSTAKKVCEDGFWKYSRHPNLFFEFGIWIGFAIAAIKKAEFLLGMISPLALFIIVNFLSLPITEKHMAKSRPYWEDYCSRTNRYFPFFKLC